MLGGYSLRYVFTDVHELLLRKYLLRVSTFYIGLTLMEKLAEVYAVKPEHNIPMSCDNYTGLLTRTRSPPKPKHIWNCDKSDKIL